MPMAETAVMDPFIKRPTVAFQCRVVDGTTGNSPYSRDPRYVLEKCVANLNKSGICDHARIGPEAEFFIFDDVRYGESMGHSMYQVDSGEAFWNSGRQEPGGNLAYKNRAKEGYFPSPPFDTLVDIRNDMVAVMESIGMHVEASHHEVGAAGQCEIDFRFGGMMETADAVGWYKYIVRNVAKVPTHENVRKLFYLSLSNTANLQLSCQSLCWEIMDLVCINIIRSMTLLAKTFSPVTAQLG